MRTRNLLAISLFLFPLFCEASQFDFNINCKHAYREIISLKLKKGQTLLDQEKKSNPENLIPVLLENYIDFVRIFVSGDENLFDQLEANKDVRLNALKNGDASSPYFLYAQAEVNLQWALNSLRFRQYFTAVLELRRAYKLLEENLEKFPEFLPNQKSMAMIRALLGNVPSSYSWGISLLGMEGNLNQGMAQLHSLLTETDSNFIFRDEVINVYASLLFHLEGKREEAWQVLQQEHYPKEGDLFSYFNTAKMAVYSGHNEAAIQILSALPKDNDYESFAQIEYLKGLSKLNKLDPDAHIFFERFVEQTKGTESIKSAYQKAGWCYLINGQTVQYNECMKKVKENGKANTEADQQAEKEANGSIPDIDLLKARLLFDGGYYKEAMKTIENKTVADYRDFKNQLELIYRKARIYDAMKNEEMAVSSYVKTIEMGKEQPYYYAANAALSLGLLYEEKGDKEKAKHYFNQCISMDNHEYSNSLNNKAKAGLERLK